MPAPTERHETRALLRAHLAAASGYRHLTRHCPICHRLLRLAMEPLTAPQEPHRPEESGDAADPPPAPHTASGAPAGAVGAPPLTTRPRTADSGPAEDLRPDPAGDGPRGHPDPYPGDESPPAT
ncbi:DUF6274 family protein [Streptomyces sp. NPDC052071]|uniref:DUF6274 family protein n=1 Tax=Streptomyces TaxID=1883 RepID=UPI0026DFF8DF|nr:MULTISPECIES: DUF6274 family protein [Streptomyces]MDX3184335.1 DUF6274 family protein [Streptomyces sp. ME02-7008A-1]MDX3304286.1 DUF6274 family protein [Streptomyces sp. ME02-7008A]WKV78936.1 hypothetical protein HBB06_12625 [Streptomyces sp. SNU607]WSK29224.1 DUF6274 family protein [[Kitasatospora] papulosa]